MAEVDRLVPQRSEIIMASDDLLDRTKFLKIDEKTRQSVRSFLPVLDGEMSRVLPSFYDEIRKWPNLESLFGGDAGIAHASAQQRKHWARLFTGNFDAEYQQSIRRIGKVTARSASSRAGISAATPSC